MAAAVFSAAALMAQTPSAKEFNDRYQLLVSKLGLSGVGIETLLNRWAAAYPDDTEMLSGKFSYYLDKSRTASVVQKDQKRFLGEQPILTLKDSTGKNVNYFQEYFYDDDLFGEAQKAIGRHGSFRSSLPYNI